MVLAKSCVLCGRPTSCCTGQTPGQPSYMFFYTQHSTSNHHRPTISVYSGTLLILRVIVCAVSSTGIYKIFVTALYTYLQTSQAFVKNLTYYTTRAARRRIIGYQVTNLSRELAVLVIVDAVDGALTMLQYTDISWLP